MTPIGHPTAPETQARPSFDDVFGFYRESGFLYPAKLAALAPQLPAIERTWRRLLAADPHLFRFVAQRAEDGELRHAISAFLYAPGTWQVQHLVSRRRHQPAGTLRVLSELVRWLHDSGAGHVRLFYRPDNPGTNRLFGALARDLPAHVAHAETLDYALVPEGAERLPRPRVAVERLAPADAGAAIGFYETVLHPVELAALRLDDPELDGPRPAFRAHGLRRGRRLLVAGGRHGVAGACIVNHASEGMNFSFLENAVEHLRVAPGLSGRRRRDVWHALAAAALAETRTLPGPAVMTLAPADRDLAVAAGLLGPAPKQYTVITGSREGFPRTIECFEDYYRARSGG